MDVTMVAAVARNGVIGRDEDVPWHLPDDLRRFRAMTMGHTLVMGRRTFEAIGRPLPDRHSVVLTRDPLWTYEGVTVVGSIEDALNRPGPIFVIGGGEIYRLAMPHATRIELTEVDLSPEGDTTFPELDRKVWEETFREAHEGFSYVTYRRADEAHQRPSVGDVTLP